MNLKLQGTFRRCAFGVASLGVCAFVGAGCDTTDSSSQRVVHVALQPGGRVSVGGRTVEVKELPARLKAMSASSHTRIRVTLRADTPAPTVTRIAGMLSSAGYLKVAFVRPKQAVSFTGNDKDDRGRK